MNPNDIVLALAMQIAELVGDRQRLRAENAALRQQLEAARDGQTPKQPQEVRDADGG